MGDVSVRACHDRKGVEVVTDNDVVDLDLVQAKELADELGISIQNAEKFEPKAPAPLFLSGHDAKEEFAQCGRMEPGYTWAGGIGGYEIHEENLEEIIAWCLKAREYIRENK